MRPFQASFGPESPLLANAAPGDAIEIELSGGGQELHIKDVRLRASQHAHSFTSSLLPPALAPPRGWLLHVLRAARGECGHSQGGRHQGGKAPGGRGRHCLVLKRAALEVAASTACQTAAFWSTQASVQIHSLPELLSSIDVELRRALVKRPPPQEPPRPHVPSWEQPVPPGSVPRSPRTPH